MITTTSSRDREIVHQRILFTCLLFSTFLLAGCIGQDDTVVDYRLRCTDDASESVRDCNDWKTIDRTYFQLDMPGQTVTRWVEDETPKQYSNCKIYNLDHWSCAAEIGMGAVEFKRGRLQQVENDQFMREGTKRVAWFEWWSTWLISRVFG